MLMSALGDSHSHKAASQLSIGVFQGTRMSPERIKMWLTKIQTDNSGMIPGLMHSMLFTIDEPTNYLVTSTYNHQTVSGDYC